MRHAWLWTVGAVSLAMAGCATEEHAQREAPPKRVETAQGTSRRIVAPPGSTVIVQTRQRTEPSQRETEAERSLAAQRAQLTHQQLQQAEQDRQLAEQREAVARARADRAAEEARQLRSVRSSETSRADAAEQQAAQAQKELEAQSAQVDQLRQRQAQLEAQLQQQQQLAQQRQAQLEQMQQQHADAEARAKQALEQVASVRQEARGLVVSLSAPVLFQFDEATILPSAHERLDAIANALRMSGDQSIRIEGYTDSVGSDAYNLELSRRRAEAVRDYLMDRGVSPDKLQALGFGKSRPIASNDTASGRADNRRVEIVLPQFGEGVGIGGAGQEGTGQQQGSTQQQGSGTGGAGSSEPGATSGPPAQGSEGGLSGGASGGAGQAPGGTAQPRGDMMPPEPSR